MNSFIMKLPAVGKNEAFARNVVASFAIECSPTIEEINDVKTAVSEAVTNAVVHAYTESALGEVEIECHIEDDNALCVCVRDFGRGIDNLDEALQPFYTTSPQEERSGMGFTIIQTFMDEMRVESQVGKGTAVYMKKVMKGC